MCTLHSVDIPSTALSIHSQNFRFGHISCLYKRFFHIKWIDNMAKSTLDNFSHYSISSYCPICKNRKITLRVPVEYAAACIGLKDLFLISATQVKRVSATCTNILFCYTRNFSLLLFCDFHSITNTGPRCKVHHFWDECIPGYRFSGILFLNFLRKQMDLISFYRYPINLHHNAIQKNTVKWCLCIM